MGQALAFRQADALATTLDETIKLGELFAKSGMFSDTKEAAKCVVKILAGREMGFGPFASMQNVHIIQGRPALSANLIAAAIKRSKHYNYRVLVSTNQECEVEFFEGGQSVGVYAFTVKDAATAGLAGKDMWKKFPKSMLFCRAISAGARQYCPDILGGAPIYTPEELGAEEDGEGNVIEAPAFLPDESPRPRIAPYEERVQQPLHRTDIASPHQRTRLEELGSALDPDALNYEQAKAELARLLNPQDKETAIQVARGMIATAIKRSNGDHAPASQRAMQNLHVALAGLGLHVDGLREDVVSTLVRPLGESELSEAEASALALWLNNGNNVRMIDLIWPPAEEVPQEAPAVAEFQGEVEAVA